MEAESIEATETYLKVLAWLHANQKKLMIVGGVVAVIAMIIGIMAWQKSVAESDADAQLLSVPLETARGNQLVPAQAGPFLDLAQKYPNTSAGEYALLLAAGTLFTEGKYPEAHDQFDQFIQKFPESPLVSQAQVGLAACLEGEGKISESVQKYQEILSTYASEANIVTPVKLTLARLYEGQNKPDKALQLYVDLAHINNPYDPWAAEARERGDLLLAKHPELRKAPPPSPASGVLGASPSASQPQYTPIPPHSAPVPAPAKPQP
jgi:predicted negative regulator of RcsB-dependent stress response